MDTSEKSKSFRYQKLTKKVCTRSAWTFFIIYLVLWLPDYVLSGGERGGGGLLTEMAAIGLFLSLLLSGIVYRIEWFKKKFMKNKDTQQLT